MTLGVKERILLFGLLPATGDITSLRILRQLREQIALSEEENQRLNIRQSGSTFQWDPAGDQPKEIEIGPKAHSIIAGALKSLSDSGQLTIDHIDLYDRFITDEPAASATG